MNEVTWPLQIFVFPTGRRLWNGTAGDTVIQDSSSIRKAKQNSLARGTVYYCNTALWCTVYGSPSIFWINQKALRVVAHSLSPCCSTGVMCLSLAFCRSKIWTVEICVSRFLSLYCEGSSWKQLLSPSHTRSNVVLLPPNGYHLNCSLSAEVTGYEFQLSQTMLLLIPNYFPVCFFLTEWIIWAIINVFLGSCVHIVYMCSPNFYGKRV